MKNFLERSQAIRDTLKFNKEFDKLLKYQDELNINNNHIICRKSTFSLEEVLGYLEAEEYIGNIHNSRISKEDLVTIIFKTILSSLPALKVLFKDKQPDLYKLGWEDGSKYDELLKKFVKTLKDDDTIISFNYDVVIDYYLINYRNGAPVNYGIKLEGYEDPSNNSISLLKLNGSINWRACPDCRKTTWLGVNSLFKTTKTLTDVDKYGIYELFETELLYICEHSKRKHIDKDILILPPTWYKRGYKYEIMQTIWRKASEKLENAKEIIFIGYSLPQTDIAFKYLLLSSLAKNKNKFSVQVIDPQIQNIAKRYLEIFKDNISLRAITFEEYCGQALL